MKLKYYDKEGNTIQKTKVKDEVLSSLLSSMNSLLAVLENHFDETQNDFSDVKVVQIIDKKNEEDIKINVSSLKTIMEIMEEKNAVSLT